MAATLPLPSARATTTIISACVLLLFIYSFSLSNSSWSTATAPPLRPPPSRPQTTPKPSVDFTKWQKGAEPIIDEAKSFIETPIRSPFKDKFYELGRRTRAAREWVKFLDDTPKAVDNVALLETVEEAIGSLFPFIKHSPKRPDSKTPLSDLRSSFVPGSRGIVIPTGKATMRYASHLIGSLQEVLHTNLTIQIVFAGDEDFPAADRERLHSRFKEVEFLNILTVLDDSTVKLATGGWAIKAFAALYSQFEEVILLDADSVFVQVPEMMHINPSYSSTGALLFHDRLLWKHAYPDRHEWWKSQIHKPSATLNKSLVWTEDYAEEGDSGVVVINKSRLDVLMGLLHVAWQNTYDVREEVTYKITYGDKETWWFGFELAGSAYAFEDHYGAMVGWFRDKDQDLERICSFVIGHVDERDNLLWYNGGLLKNKKVDPREFGVPTHTMVDGTWEKGADRKEMSCMVGHAGKKLSEEDQWILEKSVALSKDLDEEFGFL
ncbi:hypothetical protein EsH8_III_001226 [Colletotrichum jinshuiense]